MSTTEPVQQTATQFSLPAPADLAREASAYLYVEGNQYLAQYGGQVIDTDLVLSYPPVEAGNGDSPHFAYAIYAIQGIEEPALTLEVRIDQANEAYFWLGVGDWTNNTWDFTLGSRHTTMLASLENIASGLDHILGPKDQIAVAVILVDEAAALNIDYLRVTTTEEVQNLTASDDRWDGVELTWDELDNANGYNVFRRPAADPEAEWELLTAERLGRHQDEYTDTTAPGGIPLEYRVSVGIWQSVQGLPEWFWSPGATVIGLRQATEVGPMLEPFSEYWPACMWNKLSFFYTPVSAPDNVEGLTNLDYPPGNDWVHYDTDTAGYADFTLGRRDGFAAPYYLYHLDTRDNTALTVFYGTVEGVFAQVAAISDSSEVTWNEPLLIRGEDNHLLGAVKLPRAIGCITWNTVAQRIELVDSQDMTGTLWYVFDPDAIGWHIVGDREPDDNRIDFRYFGGGERITFRERDTGLAVCYERNGLWDDISPDIEVGPGPVVRFALTGLSLPGYAMMYLTPDQKRIRLLRQPSGGSWLTSEIEDVVIAKGESRISEFQLMTSEEISYQNYLVYVVDGILKLRYTESARLNGLEFDLVVDDLSTNIRDLRVIKIGNGEEWSSLDYVTYVSDGADGPVLNFRNLNQVAKPD
ncbi:hypothetical protein JW859_03550 [bacterium]|nr:hypothetical protein [bacterium]